MTAHIIYLHGFASSPGSTKAGVFREKLTAYSVNYVVPDLNVPSFEQLSLTAMLQKVAQTVDTFDDGPVYLIGSSMGGLTAVHFMQQYRGTQAARVEKIVLMAPALDFFSNRQRQDASMLDQWRDQGFMMFFNYAAGEELPVHYGLIEDIQQYDSYAVSIHQPILIFHGLNDESVDYHQSVRFAEARTSVDLRLLDSDHQLLDQTDFMMREIVQFFALA